MAPTSSLRSSYVEPCENLLGKNGVGCEGSENVIELVCDRLSHGSGVDDIDQLCACLKASGRELDKTNKELVDRLLNILRLSLGGSKVDAKARFRVLEVLELRALKWKPSAVVSGYYSKKLSECNTTNITSSCPPGNLVTLTSSAAAVTEAPPTPSPPRTSSNNGTSTHSAAKGGGSWKRMDEGDNLIIGGKSFSDRMVFFNQRFGALVGDIDAADLFWEPKPKFGPTFAPAPVNVFDWKRVEAEVVDGQFDDADDD